MASISERENRQIEAANASGNTPVVFIHGLWLLPSSWDNWADFFEQAGYAPLTPDWPDDPETVEEARANPDVLAKKTLEAGRRSHRRGDRQARQEAGGDGALDRRAAGPDARRPRPLGGHGGDRPGPFRGVLPLPALGAQVAGPVLINPLNRGRAITLTFDQFKYGWANALDEEEAKELYDTYHVAGSGDRADADGQRQPQPLDRGEGRHEEPRPRARC